MSTDADIVMKDVSLVCRGCLASSGEMRNMFEWDLANEFTKMTNIQINKSDDISVLICRKCEDVVLKNRSFVEQCWQSDICLKSLQKQTRQIKKEQEIKTENKISCSIENSELYIDVIAPNMEVKILLPCPLCTETFQKRTNLSNHLNTKHHKHMKIHQRYFCIENCVYNKDVGKGKYFSGRKYLNQHIYKVHKERDFLCNNCGLSFSNEAESKRHTQTCSFIYICQVCSKDFKTNDRLSVHLLRKHPEIHKQYKSERAMKRRQIVSSDSKKVKVELEYICDSPKRSLATQTLMENIKNDVTLSSGWQPDKFGATKDETSTQTVFEDLLSMKSQEDESIFFTETISWSDIQTQTTPTEFGVSRSNKETVTSETQSPDLSMKETQTCFCLSKSSKCDNFLNTFCRTSTETQTLDFRLDNDILSFNSTETQTCFDDDINKHF